MFDRIVKDVCEHDSYFERSPDCRGVSRIAAEVTITVALRMLAYGIAADALDENWEVSETTAIQSMKRFATAVVDVYGEEYLRAPDESDVRRLLQENAERGFPGMLFSLDCMHWEWKNCPVAWTGI
jgi:hypothetical protein